MDEKVAIPFLRTRLWAQMFLQFAVQGAFMPILGRHMEKLHFTPEEQSLVFTMGGIAPVVLPLIAGQSVDRWFATQRVLSLCYFITGALLLLAGGTTSYSTMLWLSFTVAMFFGPTMALGNALSFHHLADARRDFPIVRMGGTIGYALAGQFLSAWMTVALWMAIQRPIGDGLYLAGILGLVNGVYCLTLPHTPPSRQAAQKFALGKVLAMLKDPSFAVLSLQAFVMMIFASFYYIKTSNYLPTVGVKDEWLPAVMSIGQVMEILTMLVLAWFYRRFGAKTTIAVGLGAWLARFLIFAVATHPAPAIAAQSLHGFGFAFGMAAVMIYVERIGTPDVRGSMQSFLGWIMALGGLLGAYVTGWVHGHWTRNGVSDWSSIWLVPSAGFVIVLLLFLIGFRARDAEKEPAPTV